MPATGQAPRRGNTVMRPSTCAPASARNRSSTGRPMRSAATAPTSCSNRVPGSGSRPARPPLFRLVERGIQALHLDAGQASANNARLRRLLHTKRPGAVKMVRSDQPLSAPAKLSAAHDCSEFNCGEPALDDWVRRRALQNEETGASRIT